MSNVIIEYYVNKLNRQCLYKNSEGFSMWNDMCITKSAKGDIARYCLVRDNDYFICSSCKKNLDEYEDVLDGSNSLAPITLYDYFEILRELKELREIISELKR